MTLMKTLAGATASLALMAGAALAEPALIYDLGGKFDKSFNEAGYKTLVARHLDKSTIAPAIGTIPARKQHNPDLGKRALEPDRQIVWRPGSPVSHLLNVCVCHTGRPYPYQGSCRARPPDPAQTITGEENARVNDTRRRDTHERTLI